MKRKDKTKGISYETVCDRLACMRTQKGISAQQLGYDIGVSHGYFHNIETRKANMTVRKLIETCELLSISPVELFLDDHPSDDSLTKKILIEIERLDKANLKQVYDFIHYLNVKDETD